MTLPLAYEVTQSRVDPSWRELRKLVLRDTMHWHRCPVWLLEAGEFSWLLVQSICPVRFSVQ
jgi:hypothetical protein